MNELRERKRDEKEIGWQMSSNRQKSTKCHSLDEVPVGEVRRFHRVGRMIVESDVRSRTKCRLTVVG